MQVDPSDPFSVISYNKKSPEINHTPLKTPPKWFRRPCAASFGVCLNNNYLLMFISLLFSVSLEENSSHLVVMTTEQ